MSTAGMGHLDDVTRIDFHFDIMCPFAYQTSRWIRAVRDQTGLEIHWRFFSLEEINRVEGKKHPWEREWSYGWSMLRIAALLRRRDMASVDAWYERAGRALHAEGLKPHDPEVARSLLDELGLGADTVDEAIADPTTHDDVLADHRRVIELGGFGVPTLVFPGDRPMFGPVLVDPPLAGPEVVRLWELTIAFTEFPQLYELKRPKTPSDRVATANALRPYVQARDWVSIDHGKVIPLEGDEPGRS